MASRDDLQLAREAASAFETWGMRDRMPEFVAIEKQVGGEEALLKLFEEAGGRTQQLGQVFVCLNYMRAADEVLGHLLGIGADGIRDITSRTDDQVGREGLDVARATLHRFWSEFASNMERVLSDGTVLPESDGYEDLVEIANEARRWAEVFGRATEPANEPHEVA